MPNEHTNAGKQTRTACPNAAADQEREMEEWARSLGIPPQRLKQAVFSALGITPRRIREYLRKKG